MGRLERYAAWSVVQLVAVVAVVVAPVEEGIASIVVLAVTLPLVWAWGRYHADLALNAALDEAERNRWRLAIWFVPGAIALYWVRHVRPREAAFD